MISTSILSGNSISEVIKKVEKASFLTSFAQFHGLIYKLFYITFV